MTLDLAQNVPIYTLKVNDSKPSKLTKNRPQKTRLQKANLYFTPNGGTIELKHWHSVKLRALSICQNWPASPGIPIVMRIPLLIKTNHPDQSNPKYYAQRR